MTPFTLNEMVWIRVNLAQGYTVARLCALTLSHTRHEIIEAIDACRRNPDAETSMLHVNRVLRLQASGVALVNGKPAHLVMGPWDRQHPAPQP